ncbi:hypothetical protein HOY80DRAFT_1099822 [Tuber brumale]|nr:hypothetical protein HOY80DRAFT_1099822 [Tuber brumale]
MAESIGLAASVVTLIQLSLKVGELCYDYCKTVKGSQQDFKKLGDEIASIHQLLEEIRSLASGDDKNNPQYPRLLEWTKNPSLEDYKTALEELKEKLDVPGRRESTKMLAWPFQKQKMERYLVLLEGQRSQLQLLLTTATTKTATQILRKLDGYKEFRGVLRWLNVVDPASNYSSAIDVREPGTGNWLLEGDEYREWKGGRGGVLWLYGIPGCGKTVLSAAAIEDVERLCEASNDHALAYFYFTFSDSEKQKLSNMLLSLIGQLPKRPSDRGLPGGIVDLYNGTKAVGKLASPKALKDLLSQIIKGFKKTFIVLDALDEVPKSERKGLLSWLTELTADPNLESLSILITSRPEADIAKCIRQLATFAIPLQSKTVDPDIREYIQKSLDGNDGFENFPNEIKSEIEVTLVARSQGMFRWVVCLLRILEDCIALKDVRAALERLPEDLDSVYSRILESIPGAQREYIQRAMRWLTFSGEPLTLGQLAEAVQIEYVVDKYGEDSEPLFDMESLRRICPSLISFEDARNDKSHPAESRRLRLAHFSVKEYLISDRAAKGPTAYYHISEDQANLLMGHACLSRILRHSAPGTTHGETVEKTSFLYHSARYWFVYIRSIEDTAPAPLSNAALKVLELGNIWLDVYNPDIFGGRSPVYPTAIYYSSFLNLVTACKLLAKREEDTVDVNAQGGLYGNALQAARARGHESVAQLLLSHGADLDI